MFNRDQFKSCFAELSKLMQEVSDLKNKELNDDVRKRPVNSGTSS